MSQLILIRGLPGSGKSTFAKTYFPTFKHYEADMFFMQDGKYRFNPAQIKDAHNWCQEQAKIAFLNGYDCVVSNTFVKKWEIQPYLLLCPTATIITCNSNWQNIHNVPEETLARMKQKWEFF